MTQRTKKLNWNVLFNSDILPDIFSLLLGILDFMENKSERWTTPTPDDSEKKQEFARKLSLKPCPLVYKDKIQTNVLTDTQTKDTMQYKCNKCNTVFAKAVHLKKHKSLLQSCLKCLECGKEFSQQKKLHIHMTKHYPSLEIRSGKCSICGVRFHKTFASQDSCLSHIKTYSEFTFDNLKPVDPIKKLDFDSRVPGLHSPTSFKPMSLLAWCRTGVLKKVSSPVTRWHGYLQSPKM